LEKKMKFTLNLLLTVVLFCSAALAGDQGNGGYQGCTINCPPPPPCTEHCDGRPAGEPGVEGITSIEGAILLNVVRQYLGLIS
jgi:hypothetical protein